MALVSCPECGKSKVSDTATSCPECGYNINEHFKKMKYEDKLKMHEEKIKQEKNKKEEYIKEVAKTIKKPEIPKRCSRIGYISLRIIIIFLILLGIANIINNESMNVFAGVVLLFAVYFYLFDICVGYKERKELYDLAQENFEEYKYQMALQQVEKEIKIKIQHENQQKQQTIQEFNSKNKKLVCPRCKSPNCKHISQFDRSVSIFFHGIASDKFGKQYICNECKHLW